MQTVLLALILTVLLFGRDAVLNTLGTFGWIILAGLALVLAWHGVALFFRLAIPATIATAKFAQELASAAMALVVHRGVVARRLVAWARKFGDQLAQAVRLRGARWNIFIFVYIISPPIWLASRIVIGWDASESFLAKVVYVIMSIILMAFALALYTAAVVSVVDSFA